MTPGPDGFVAVLPGRNSFTVFRYRVVGERTPGVREVIAPRPTDPIPYGFYPLFIGAPFWGTPPYNLVIAPTDWGQLYMNMTPSGAILGCSSSGADCRMCSENPAFDGH